MRKVIFFRYMLLICSLILMSFCYGCGASQNPQTNGQTTIEQTGTVDQTLENTTVKTSEEQLTEKLVNV